MSTPLRLLSAHKLESALIVSLVTLALQIGWPLWISRRRAPKAGEMVVQDTPSCIQGQNSGIGSEYWLYLPEGYEAKSGPWPLLIYLHGAGERGVDVGIVKRYGLPSKLGVDVQLPAIVAAPQCPAHRQWEPEGLARLVDEIESRYSIDRHRVYVMGHSMGGFGTFDFCCHSPERIAAAVILCGGGDASKAAQCRHIAIRAYHGAMDSVVVPTNITELVEALQRAGCDAELTMLPGEGHGIHDVPLSRPEILEWLLAQRKSELQRLPITSERTAHSLQAVSVAHTDGEEDR